MSESDDLEEARRAIEKSKTNAEERAEKVDELSNRFKELRRKNNFRVMLEEIFGG